MSAVKGDSSDTSPILFLNVKGEPMRFFIRPGPTKIQLQPLITGGGGILCRTQESSAVLLADPAEINNAIESAGQFYISTQYIHDCVVQNQQLDIEHYRLSNSQPARTRATARKQRGNGRMCYSLEDDAAVLNFIAKRQHEAKGNRVWQQMERQGITTHSWQSMKDRFLKHLQHKISVKSPAKKPKNIPLKESSSSEQNISQTSAKPHTPNKTPNKALITSSPGSNTTQVNPDVLAMTECRAAEQPSPRSSPRKRNSPHCPGSGKGKAKVLGEAVGETRSGDEPDQVPLPEEQQHQQDSDQPEVSPKRARGDKDVTGENSSERSDEHLMSPRDMRESHPVSSTCSERKLGILERAAREFEDSQIDNGSQEDRPQSRASSIDTSNSDECQFMTARERALRDQQVSTQQISDGDQRLTVAQKGRGTQGPEDDGPGPSSASAPFTSTAHRFLFDQESQEDLNQSSQDEVLSQDLLEAKQHVVNLMKESEKDLVDVTKALLKASGDVSMALTYLLGGYDHEVREPIWTRQDDEKLLSSDSSALLQLQEKYGAEGVAKRQAFLKAK